MKAFLSHSSKDKELMRKIAKAMGDNCVFDEMTFEAGMPILDEIMKGLKTSDLFVLFLSDNSLNSDWVKKEITGAKSISGDNLNRILPIIIDKNITFEDKRIPQWLKKAYNIQLIENTNIILNKIYNTLRKLRILDSTSDAKEKTLFIGRNSEMSQFEQDLNNLDMWIPTYVVAYNFITGIGRRTFLKNALRKANYLELLQEPVTISLSGSESIENLIYKLSDIKGNEKTAEIDLTKMTMVDKIKYAENLVEAFVKAKEIIFIIDDGGIISPNHDIADWFVKLCNSEKFNNRLIFCLASHYRPRRTNKGEKGLFYNINELTPQDTQSLFLNLLSISNIGSLDKDQKTRILSVLNGVPAQVKLAIECLHAGYHYAINHINEIKEFSDAHVAALMTDLKKNDLANQILLFLSTEDVMSYDVLKDVFGESDEVYLALGVLQEMSCVSDVFDGACLRLNPTMRDFINRSKQQLNDDYQKRYSEVLRNYRKKDLEVLLKEDYSKFIMVINDYVSKGDEIPKKFFMPSLLLSAIINEYNHGNHKKVIKMCEQLLTYTNYDPNIIWLTRYRLTMAYARTRNEREFNKNIEFFKDKKSVDFNFLLGFFFRILGRYQAAIEQFDKALKINPEHASSLREKVNALIAMEEYDDAVDLAEKNYRHYRNDIMHAHSYFKALICSSKLHPLDDKLQLIDLMKVVEENGDNRANDLLECMKGEYAYYIENDPTKSIEILKCACENNTNKIYAQKALFRIYKKVGMKTEAKALEKKMNERNDINDIVF